MKTSNLIAFRLPPSLIAEVLATIERVNLRRYVAPYDLSSFIRSAIADKLSHYKRSNPCRSKLCCLAPPTTPAPDGTEASVGTADASAKQPKPISYVTHFQAGQTWPRPAAVCSPAHTATC